MNHAADYLRETAQIAMWIPRDEIERLAERLAALDGRLYFVGLGGSAANASHAAADFRKLACMDAVCLTDSAASLTACANDCGWENCLAVQLGDAGPEDALFVLSVGGGAGEVSLPLVRVIDEAKRRVMQVFGVVGRDGGYTKQHGDCVIVIPTVSAARVTPHSEGWQGVLLHLLVSHPKLQVRETKW